MSCYHFVLCDVIVILCLLHCEVNGQSCEQIDSCSCSFANGGTVDLTPLIGDSGNPKWMDVGDATKSGFLYSYNPCKPFTEGLICNSVAVCQTTNMGTGVPAGLQDTATFSTDPSSQEVAITYSYGVNKTTIVSLHCVGADGADSLDVTGEEPAGSGVVLISLSSVHCCPTLPPGPPGNGTGLSYGWIISIGILGLLFIYTVGGVVIGVKVQKKQGSDIIPNKRMWGVLFGLIKDGLRFTFCYGKSGVYGEL